MTELPRQTYAPEWALNWVTYRLSARDIRPASTREANGVWIASVELQFDGDGPITDDLAMWKKVLSARRFLAEIAPNFDIHVLRTAQNYTRRSDA